MPSIPRASASGMGSCSSVRAAACRQASCAIPAPIVPAPTTPMVATSETGPAAPALPPSALRFSWDIARVYERLRASGSYALLGDQRVDPRRRAPDDQLLDLGGSLVQRGHAHVAEVALDRVVVHVARPAVHLDRRVRTPLGGLRGVVLGDGGLGGVGLPAILEEARPPHQHA